MFEALDETNLGYVTLEAVVAAFASSCPSLKREIVDAAFAELDVGKTGKVRLSFSLSFSRRRHRTLTRAHPKKSFFSSFFAF